MLLFGLHASIFLIVGFDLWRGFVFRFCKESIGLDGQDKFLNVSLL